MKVIVKIVAGFIVLLGLVHTYFAMFCNYMDIDNLWFLGAGFAVIFAGLLNFVALDRGGSKSTTVVATLVNLLMCAMFIYAIPILNNSQVYIGIGLFAVAALLAIAALRKLRVKRVSQGEKRSVGISENDGLSETKAIPMLRIFDKRKAIEFYVDWLGFKIDWEHNFLEEQPPVYMQISKSGITIHLTEHHGDCTPGGKAYIQCIGLRTYHRNLLAKKYPYNVPGLETAPWKSLCMEVIDPFGNKLLFTEPQ